MKFNQGGSRGADGPNTQAGTSGGAKGRIDYLVIPAEKKDHLLTLKLHSGAIISWPRTQINAVEYESNMVYLNCQEHGVSNHRFRLELSTENEASLLVLLNRVRGSAT